MRILLVVSRYPWPPRRGDRLRTAQLVDFLSGEHVLTVAAPEPSAGDEPVPERVRCRLALYPAPGLGRIPGVLRAGLTGQPLQTGLFHQPGLHGHLARLAGEADLAILQLVRLAPYRAALGELPVVVDLVDSIALNFRRRAARDAWWRRRALLVEARRLARAEATLVVSSRAALVVSRRDAEAVAGALASDEAERLRVLPIAVEPGPGPAPPADRPVDLILTGNLGYFPNLDGARWLLETVWPAVRQARPGLKLVVAGDRPPARLVRLAARAGAELVSRPADLRTLLRQAKLALAPLHAGSGLPIKILEAWAEGTPVLATPWAAAGTSGVPGEELAVAATPEDWQEAIPRLLDDPAARHRLAEAGRARLEADYSPEVVGETIRSIVG